MRSHLVIILIALVAALASGCGPAGASGAGSSGTGSGAVEHPTGARQLVLRVSTGGGFTSLNIALRTVPEFSLYGDGTVVVPGVIDLKYPGPAVYPLQTFKLSEDEVQSVLRAARTAGLLEPGRVDYGDMGSVAVSDMPTTTLVINAAGVHVRRAAYALGAGGPAGNLTVAQARARTQLARFIADLPRKPAAAYRPEALSVYVLPFSGDRRFSGKPVVWPLSTPLVGPSNSLPYRCVAVSGVDVGALLEQLQTANEVTEWLPRAGARPSHQLVVRPALPDQSPCND
jgi:hypothetical protein